MPYGLNLSVVIATLTFLVSLAKSLYSISKAFHASPSNGWTILLGWYQCPCLCHVICFTESSNMYNHWSQGKKGRWRRTFIGIVNCFLLPLPLSTSIYLELPHLTQYLLLASLFLNSMHCFVKTCIISYDILSALNNFFLTHTCWRQLVTIRKKGGNNCQKCIKASNACAKLRLYSK
jgi:hypothetical protein